MSERTDTLEAIGLNILRLRPTRPVLSRFFAQIAMDALVLENDVTSSRLAQIGLLNFVFRV